MYTTWVVSEADVDGLCAATAADPSVRARNVTMSFSSTAVDSCRAYSGAIAEDCCMSAYACTDGGMASVAAVARARCPAVVGTGDALRGLGSGVVTTTGRVVVVVAWSSHTHTPQSSELSCPRDVRVPTDVRPHAPQKPARVAGGNRGRARTQHANIRMAVAPAGSRVCTIGRERAERGPGRRVCRKNVRFQASASPDYRVRGRRVYNPGRSTRVSQNSPLVFPVTV